MNARIYVIILITTFFYGTTFSQALEKTFVPDTTLFNYSYWNALATKYQYKDWERAEFISGQRKIEIDRQYQEFLHAQHGGHDYEEKDIQWVTIPSTSGKYSSGNVNAGPCTNIDFESGDMTGWTRRTGFNPLTNTLGCCASPNGDQTIMTGGNDPFGNFPRVYPGGGNFSLRLGSTAIGGIADRIEQQFFVTPANANFTYRYAVVLNDPGHVASQQPKFTSEIIDSLGNVVNCTVYSVTAAGSIPGFSTSTQTGPNGSAVRYKTWTDVAVDLSPNIGQNVTMRFTVYDCSPTGHFAYAYIDGSCTSFETSVSDTTCPNVPITICAPAGFSTTTWNGPGGIVNNPNRCIQVSQPGVYTCTTLLVPGCPGPTFSHTLALLANPVINFTPITTGTCSPNYTFNSVTSISVGSIVSRVWDFGDGSTSTAQNPTHTYALPGTYNVKLKCVSNRGCSDSLIVPITIFPTPVLAFSPPSSCVNTVVQFTNTSNISVGSITGYTWNLGNGAASTLTNPVNTYTTNGTYTITLDAVSNLGCTSSLTRTLGIFPAPILSFTANPLCDIHGTTFSPLTATAIASGSLSQFFWDFGDGSTSNAPNPVHNYMAPGNYTVSLTAISNHNCSASFSSTFQILPSPTVAFATTSINACSPEFTFTNLSGISAGPITYTWSFGGSNTTTAVSPSYTFPSIGNYTVSLIGESDLGCQDTAYHYISVFPYPVINFSVPASCENAIFTVSTTAVSGSVTSYLWDFGDPGSGAANTSTLQNPTHYYSTTNNYTITLNMMSNLNCPSSTVVPITVFPNPSASFTFSTIDNCSTPFTFTNTSTTSTIGSSFINSYYWNFGGVVNTSPNPGTFNFPGPGTHSVSLIVKTNHNCADTMSADILVHPLPSLTFSSLPVCQNQPVNFVSSSSISPIPLPGASITSYTWNFGDNTFDPNLTPPPKSYTAAGTYTVELAGMSDMGCVDSFTALAIVHPMPVSDFDPTGSMCFSTTTSFTSNSSIGAGNVIYSYLWDFGDGYTSSGVNVLHTYTASGTYPVTFSTTTNNECVTAVTKTITIHPVPTASFAANGGCLGSVTNFTDMSTIGPPASNTIVSWTWDFGDGSTPSYSTFQSPSHIYQTPGPPAKIPTLTVTTNFGCSGTATTGINIHPLPQIAFSPAAACVSTAIQFTNTSMISSGSNTLYIWDFNDGSPVSNLVSPVHTYTNATTLAPYVVTLTAVSNQGCVNSGVTSLTIHPFPSGTITTINSACVGDLIAINPNISITGINQSISYTVGFGDGSPPIITQSSIGLTASHTYSAYNTYTVAVAAASDFGCTQTFTNTVAVYPRPFVNFTSSGFCHNSGTQFVNTSTIAPQYNIIGYSWDFDDGASPPSNSVNPTYTFVSYGVHDVTLTAYSQPELTLACNQSAVKSVTIHPLPFNMGFTTNSVCLGTATNFTNTTPSSSITGWSWFFTTPGVLDNVAQHPSFTFTTPGIHTPTLTANNIHGCKKDTSFQVMVYTNPNASFVADTACFGLPSHFINQTQAGTGSSSPPTYTWSINNNAFSNANNPQHVLSASGIHTVQLRATTPGVGCTHVFSGTVLVHALPQVNFNAQDICHNEEAFFSNLTNGALTYTWNFGETGSSSNISNLTSPSHSYASVGSYSVKLKATNGLECIDSLTKNVFVHGLPIANFLLDSICTGDVVNFVNLSSSSDGSITSYYWDFNGDNIIDNELFQPKYTYQQVGNYIVRLEVRTQYGCSHVTTKSVYANPKPSPIVSSDTKTGCPSLCVNFKDLSVIAAGTITNTVWDFGDGSPVVRNAKSPVHCYGSGVYDLSFRAFSNRGCSSEIKMPGYITVHQNPTAGFVVSPSEVDEDDPTIAVSSTASSDVTQTRYFISDGTNINGQNFNHVIKLVPKTNPMVVQIVKNQFGCVDTLYQVLKMKPTFVIYVPNVFTPNEDGRNDSFFAKGVGISRFAMQIYDRWGHLVWETKDITQGWDGTKGGEQVKQDVYTWKAQVVDIFNSPHELVGHVTLIR